MALDKATLKSELKQIQLDAKDRDLYPNGMDDDTFAGKQADAFEKFVKSGALNIPLGQPVGTPDTLVGTNTAQWSGTVE